MELPDLEEITIRALPVPQLEPWDAPVETKENNSFPPAQTPAGRIK